jgi:hypothetical protein
MRKAVELSTGPDLILASLGHSYAVSGKRAQALDILDQMKEKAKREHVSAFFVGLIYTGLGDKDKAFELLEAAYQEKDAGLIHLKVDPRLDRLRSDPRLTSGAEWDSVGNVQ